MQEGKERLVSEIRAILERQKGEKLRVEYHRSKEDGGRWYARGKAQLQSCCKETRTIALRNVGWEVDLRASFQSIVVGLMKEIGGETEIDPKIAGIATYVRSTEEVRARVAVDYGTKPCIAKKLFNRLTFGGGIARWKKEFKVEAQARSEEAERDEKQMQRARVLIAAWERSRGAAKETKDKTLASKAVGRAEEALMRRLSDELEAAGWKTGSLIT